ncbi:hypothetical protein BKA65DRAFT_531519 [Rhexocercosporidium sp. MPI-PUGE-AT-0058]|nr:hypothetical protein BKA65DRAFT_531519 [Rhexocercosporidium sp. MPI-PUGE-AT-0058]
MASTSTSPRQSSAMTNQFRVLPCDPKTTLACLVRTLEVIADDIAIPFTPSLKKLPEKSHAKGEPRRRYTNSLVVAKSKLADDSTNERALFASPELEDVYFFFGRLVMKQKERKGQRIPSRLELDMWLEDNSRWMLACHLLKSESGTWLHDHVLAQVAIPFGDLFFTNVIRGLQIPQLLCCDGGKEGSRMKELDVLAWEPGATLGVARLVKQVGPISSQIIICTLHFGAFGQFETIQRRLAWPLH